MATLKDFDNWLNNLARFGRINDHVEELNAEVGRKDRRVKIYTDVNYYAISVREPTLDKEDGYLGCITSCRKPRAGEDWTRGNDLADGPLTEETWLRILSDIISYEMVKIHKPAEPVADTPEVSAA